MDEENQCSSLPNMQLQRAAPSPTDPSMEDVAWSETQSNEVPETEQVHIPSHGQQDPLEDTEDLEPLFWPVPPLTFTTASLSFATVRWDMPDDASETHAVRTESTMNQQTTSSLLQRSHNVRAGLVSQEDREEQNLRPPSDLPLEVTGNGSELRDGAVDDPLTQGGEGLTLELLDDSSDEFSVSTDSEGEERRQQTTDAVEIVPSDDIPVVKEEEEQEDPDDAIDLGVDFTLKEEKGGQDVLLTGQTDSEEVRASVDVVQAEEESEAARDADEDAHSSEESPSDEEVQEEPQQAEDTWLTIGLETLIHSPQRESSGESRQSDEELELLKFPAVQRERPENCEDVDQNAAPGPSETVFQRDDSVESHNQRADGADWIRPCPELTAKQDPPGCLECQASEQKTSEDTAVLIQAEELIGGDSRPSPLLEQATETRVLVEPANTEAPQNAVPSGDAEPREETEPSWQNEQQRRQSASSPEPAVSERQVEPQAESGIMEQLFSEAEVTQPPSESNQTGPRAKTSHRAEESGFGDNGTARIIVANGEQSKPENAMPHMNGGGLERQMARRLAERLNKLDGIQRVDVVKHLDKDNDFSRAVGEEYLRYFDFSGQTLDRGLRSFLKVVLLIGETQERERVLQHFAGRFHECNPDSYSSSEAVLALTCALMLLNTDLHGQNVGKSMSSSKFVSNLEKMNNGENFNKDLLKSLYNSIKREPLEWAVDEEELRFSVLADEDAGEDAPLRSKSNPFQDVPHDKTAPEVKRGLLHRKIHADIDGKRTPWGKRGWKMFYGCLKGMVLYLQKDPNRRDNQSSEEVVSVHHSLAEPATDYTKKPHVFRLQTADWRVFLFQVPTKTEMNSWINRINLVSALHSSPPFPAAVGSQRRFCRPILPASQSAHTLERQLQSHTGMLESFRADLSYLQDSSPEGKKAKARDLEEHRVRGEYLQYEICRYEIYTQALGVWTSVAKSDGGALNGGNLKLFDKAVVAGSAGEDDEDEEVLQRAYSSPSLEVDFAPSAVVKVRRNISERRTYRRRIIPRQNKEL